MHLNLKRLRQLRPGNKCAQSRIEYRRIFHNSNFNGRKINVPEAGSNIEEHSIAAPLVGSAPGARMTYANEMKQTWKENGGIYRSRAFREASGLAPRTEWGGHRCRKLARSPPDLRPRAPGHWRSFRCRSSLG